MTAIGERITRPLLAVSRQSPTTASAPLPTLGSTGSERSTTNQLAARGPTQSAAHETPVLNARQGCIQQHIEEILGLLLDVDQFHVAYFWRALRAAYL
jgi:hypothetical protein